MSEIRSAHSTVRVMAARSAVVNRGVPISRRPRVAFAAILHACFCMVQARAQDLPDDIDIGAAPEGIVAMPKGLPRAFRRFNRYTKVITANGKAIHIIAQSRISEGQIVRAREILRMFLTDVRGSEFGAAKAALGNRMAANEAMLMLVNGTHSEGNEPNLPAQPLYQNEMQVEGHRWYIEQDYDHRDATFEEILHLVHDTGIGVDGRNTQPGVLPAYQAEIRRATNNAMADNFQIWPLGARRDREWYDDLAAENSLTQEYLASLIDSYYGLWGAWTERASLGMWGEYIAKTRDEIRREDPMGWALLGKFFPEHLTYEARIDPDFTGTFRMTFDQARSYTHHSQYLLKARLVGTRDSDLTGNALDNILTGNEGNNVLDGAAGEDTAVFHGKRAEYAATKGAGGRITLVDSAPGRDGSDTLVGIEFVRFSDRTVPVAQLVGDPASHLEAWREEYFAVEMGDPGLEATVWGNLADPDGDGAGNLVEFAFGSDPRRASGSPPISNLRIDGRFIRLTISGLTSDPATIVEAQMSSDLRSWSAVAGMVENDIRDTEGRRTLDLGYPLPGDAATGFVRFVVRRN